MKIAHVIEDLSCGGAEKACVELCNYLVNQNEVYLICLYNKDDPSRFFWGKKIDNRIKLFFLNKKPGLDKAIFCKLSKKLHSINPDIVNIHLWSLTYAWIYLMLHKKAKIIYTIHSTNVLDDTRRRKYFYWILFRLRTINLLANSSSVMDFTKRTFKVKRCLYINLGVNLMTKTNLAAKVSEEINNYKNSADTIVLLNVAKLKVIKNHLLLLEAHKQLIDRGYDVIILIIGEEADKTYYAKLMKVRTNGVYFIGNRENVGDYFAIADYFCITSDSEGLSLATIEAMSMGVLPVVTPAGGITDIVKDGYNGVLSVDHTKESYVQALIRAIELKEDEKYQMKQNALSTYREYFTMQKCGAQYLEFYETLFK